ncbi:MAG: hypothetical protein K0S32_93 [Bacteroidetes bacterium]|jgi:hypothetical protein|nr:hypothetical protein [Bacteroidota bacterium]
MKKIIFLQLFFYPVLLFSQVKFTVNETNYSVEGTKIYDHRSYSRTEAYLETTNDSIVYHEIVWEEKDVAVSEARTYKRMSFAKKDCKKPKSVDITELPEKKSSSYLLSVFFKSGIQIWMLHAKGIKPVVNRKSIDFQAKFDSKETVDKLVDDYFKKK